jgi:hypothetical protein
MENLPQTPDATESLGIWLENQQGKELNLAAFSPMAEFAAVAAGRNLRVFSWDRKADLCWTPCWTETVLRDCMKESEHMIAIVLSTYLVAVAAKGGFAVYELHTTEQRDPTTVLKKEPVIQVRDVDELRTIALSPEAPEISGRICAGTGDGRLLIWDIQRGSDGHYSLMPQRPHELFLQGQNEMAPDVPSAVAFSHDSSRICVGSVNRHIYIYERGEDWSLVKQIRLEGNFVSRLLTLRHIN